jgi:hypothetical protein
LLPDNCGNLLPPPSAAAVSINSLYSSGAAAGSRLNSRLGLQGAGVGYGLSQANHTEHLFQQSMSAGVSSQDHNKLMFENKHQMTTDLFGNKDWQVKNVFIINKSKHISFNIFF